MSELDIAPAGLGIDLCPRAAHLGIRNANGVALNLSSLSGSRLHDNIRVREDHLASRDQVGNSEVESLLIYTGPHATLRSMTSMRGLLLAEVGDSMVEFDIGGGGSGFREGQRIALESVTPGGGSNLRKSQKHFDVPAEDTSLSRHGTLLSVGATPGRNAAELKSLLGNSNSRLKPGAAILQLHGQTFHGNKDGTSLEQAKARARVEVDIALESNTCVQGGYLKGHIKIRIRKRSKKESDVEISGGKVRVVGFECIPNEDDRHTFYQCSAPLSAVTASSGNIYASHPDAEGFAKAREGVHSLPFAMFLPLDGEVGNSKGAVHVHSGVTVRYIAMVSIKVKDSETRKRSIAHFFRNCKIWPRLNPSVILVASPRPIQATVSKNLFMGGSGKVKLTATLHRLYWVAGQLCYVKVNVANDTKKTVKSLTLTLIRSTIVFKPHPHLDALPPSHEHATDPDACQTSTTQKHVAETTLEMGQRGARGHASAKGWWTGVRASEQLDFSHFLLIPPDALSVTRGRLLEVEYTIRVSLSAGSLASDVQVILPIRIINFLSIDPPPSFPLSSQENSVPLASAEDGIDITDTYIAALTNHNQHPRPAVSGIFAQSAYYQSSRVLGPVSEDEDEPPIPSDHDSDYASHDEPSDFTDENSQFDEAYAILTTEQDVDNNTDSDSLDDGADLGNLSMYDDSDNVVQHAITAARIDTEYGENAPRFADLYYASVQKDPSQPDSRTAVDHPEDQEPELWDRSGPGDGSSTSSDHSIQHSQSHAELRPNSRPLNAGSYESRPSCLRGPSSFALRVQEKLQAATCAIDNGRLPPQVGGSNLKEKALEGPSMLGDSDEARDNSNFPTSTSVFDSSGGSYFSARVGVEEPGSLSLPIERQPENSTASSSGSSDSGYHSANFRIEHVEDTRHLDARLPSDNSFTDGEVNGQSRTFAFRIGSSALSGSGFSVKPPAANGSRLLPRPPSLPAMPITATDPGLASSALATAHPQEIVSVSYGSQDKHTAYTGIALSRPPFAPAVGGGGSVSSVKDKIRELEERFRAEESKGTK